jgi:20S proteasome subunit alpha 5
LISCCK